MLCGVHTQNGTRNDYGKCESDYPYCNDNGICQRNKRIYYTGLNKRYNHKHSIFVIILAILCFMMCAYFGYKITMNLIEGCKDGDMFSCFILFKSR
jgi:hypothetical protein